MPNVFSYLNSPPAAHPDEPQHITQQEEGGRAPLLPPEPEQFDEAVEADLDDVNVMEGGKWVLPDPVTFPGGDLPQTPLDRLAAVVANVGIPRTQQNPDTAVATTPTPPPAHLRTINQCGGDLGTTPATSASAQANHHVTLPQTPLWLQQASWIQGSRRLQI